MMTTLHQQLQQALAAVPALRPQVARLREQVAQSVEVRLLVPQAAQPGERPESRELRRHAVVVQRIGQRQFVAAAYGSP